MQIGVDSFVAATVDAAGRAVDPAKHLSELLETMTLADEVGLDVFGIGEHHRHEFLDSAPTVILAAAAARSVHNPYCGSPSPLPWTQTRPKLPRDARNASSLPSSTRTVCTISVATVLSSRVAPTKDSAASSSPVTTSADAGIVEP